jgi:hypothetical protein
MTNPSDRPGTPGEAQSDALAGWFSGWADAWRIQAGLGLPQAPERSAPSFCDAVLSVPAQACWIGLTAWLRYLGAVAEAFALYEASLMQAALGPTYEVRGTAPSEGRVLVDEMRTLLRRVGEAASLEARRARYELEQVGESIARAAAADEGASIPHGQQVRRHEVKA